MKQGVAVSWAALLTLAVGACQDGYPVAPTQCDELCHVLERADCGQDPAECVLSCEQSGLFRGGCDAEVDLMLSCLSRAPSDRLGCGPLSTFECANELSRLQDCRFGDAGPES